jgi:hypothetical protein
MFVSLLVLMFAGGMSEALVMFETFTGMSDSFTRTLQTSTQATKQT